jgi:membrane protein CcdC involved in cytochrome C biogenesis
VKAMTKLRPLVVELGKHGFVSNGCQVLDSYRCRLSFCFYFLWARKTRIREQYVYLSSGFAFIDIELKES